MIEQEIKTFEHCLVYAVEKTAIYYRLMGAQFFNGNNWGITTEQFCVLEALYYSQEEVCQRDISKKILKDRSNTSRILNILEEKGLISRAIDMRQKRLVKMVSITSEGRELYDKILPSIRDLYLQTLEGVSMDDIELVKKVLEQIRNNMSKDTTIQI